MVASSGLSSLEKAAVELPVVFESGFREEKEFVELPYGRFGGVGGTCGRDWRRVGDGERGEHGGEAII